MAAISTPHPSCPLCGSDRTHVAEDVSDEVTVLGCDACGRTWAARSDDNPPGARTW